MPLERCKSIDQAKSEDGILVMTIPRTKCSLLFVAACNQELLIGLTDVELCKICRTGEAVDQLANPGWRVVVFLCDLV